MYTEFVCKLMRQHVASSTHGGCCCYVCVRVGDKTYTRSWSSAGDKAWMTHRQTNSPKPPITSHNSLRMSVPTL